MFSYRNNNDIKLDRETREKLKHQYLKNKKRFEDNMHDMNRDQVILEHLLLSIEKDMISSKKKPETLEEAIENSKKKFLNGLECCNKTFETLNDFIEHMETNHENEDEVFDFSQDSPFYFPNFPEEPDIQEKENAFEPNAVLDENAIPKKTNKTKPFKCTVPNCKKSYTSSYGLRYHIENGHVEKDESDKPYACQFKNCNKRYKNTNGLKYHVEHNHASELDQ